MLGHKIPERIDGIGLMHSILTLAISKRFSIYLLGATQNIVESCEAIIRTRFPDIRIAGYRNGYFKSTEWDNIAESIKASKADILFLGMGSPTKEKLGEYLKTKSATPIIQGVGGSFDVMAGLVRRAPIWMQKLGLEWLFRVLQEPKRMFWRYLKTNSICTAIFLKTFAKQRILSKSTKKRQNAR
jgi:N-acetylglucosaminyldiphosphoundecaprenol N-acetyl-beta-D-mannosaminyltransferase